MLNVEQIKQNKERFLELINSIQIEGANIQDLVEWLEGSDFFMAPASAQYHCDFAGGLCYHSLNVYDTLVKLCNSLATNYSVEEDGDSASEIVTPMYSDDTIKVVALLHDISKANFYESYRRNVKNEETGKWEEVQAFRTRDANNRFIYGNHEQNSEFMVRTFIPLNLEQSSAILHHHMAQGWDSIKEVPVDIIKRYPLSLLLHMADMYATFVIENE